MFYIENLSFNPFYNLAFEEYFMMQRKDLPDVFLLWQNEPTVVVGRHQNVNKEVNLQFLQEKAIHLVRRNSGGGAVYHDLGNLNYTFITTDQNAKVSFERFTNPVIQALKAGGVQAELSGRNDILVAGCKISGNAQYLQGNRIMHHGTLLFASNLDEVETMLTPDPDKLKARGVDSVRSRITNISEHLPEIISLAEFKRSLLQYMDSYTGIEQINCTEADLQIIQQLTAEKYTQPFWNFGTLFNYNAAYAQRFSWGELGCQLWIQEKTIMAGKLYGDFFSHQDLTELEQQLTGLRPGEENFTQAIADMPVEDYISGITREEWSQLINLVIQNGEGQEV